MYNMNEENQFLAGRIYQYVLTTAKKADNQTKIITHFGIEKGYDLITIIKILDKNFNKKAIFVVEPTDYGCELIIHINKINL